MKSSPRAKAERQLPVSKPTFEKHTAMSEMRRKQPLKQIVERWQNS
jgi:hypothetical protein